LSSSTFSTELTPDSRLRMVVLLSGLTTTMLGLLTIATLTGVLWLRLCVAAAWLVVSARELLHIAKSYKRCRRIRFVADGSITVQTPEGAWLDGKLLSGSVVLGGLAWLRIEVASGEKFAEPLRGNCRKNKHWRRLQVIWRHLGAAR